MSDPWHITKEATVTNRAMSDRRTPLTALQAEACGCKISEDDPEPPDNTQQRGANPAETPPTRIITDWAML